MTTWRWRRCPACQTIMPAGKLLTFPEPRADMPWSRGEMRRGCPLCGHRGRTADFEVVRERHAQERSA